MNQTGKKLLLISNRETCVHFFIICLNLSSPKNTHAVYLVEVFTCGSHLLPGFVEQLDADAEEFLEGAIVGKEHGVEVVAVFTGCGHKREKSCHLQYSSSLNES